MAIQAFGVARFTDLERRIDEDFDEVTRRASVFDQLPGRVAITAIGADEGGQRDEPGGREQLGHRGNPPNVLAAIFLRKPQSKPLGIGRAMFGQFFGARVEAVSDVVPIQEKTVQLELMQFVIDHIRNRTLAAAAQAGEPDNTAAVAIQGFAFCASHVMFVPRDLDLFAHRDTFRFMRFLLSVNTGYP